MDSGVSGSRPRCRVLSTTAQSRLPLCSEDVAQRESRRVVRRLNPVLDVQAKGLSGGEHAPALVADECMTAYGRQA